VARIFIFDSDPAGLACHEPGNPDGKDLRSWMDKEWADGAILVIPAIIDYEVRRELIRKKLWDAVKRLDTLYDSKFVNYAPISQAAMNRAAGIWADARRRGNPTDHHHGLDGDVILSAQAMEYCSDTADDWQIITENIDDIARYVGDRARSRRAVVVDWQKTKRGIVS